MFRIFLGVILAIAEEAGEGCPSPEMKKTIWLLQRQHYQKLKIKGKKTWKQLDYYQKQAKNQR